MLKSHEKFHSANGRRLILIVDDERINRELLGAVLSTDYELIFAENGREALEKIRANKDQLSLVLLDLLMPVMSGTEVLREIQADPELQKIPVIVLTSDQNAEIRSLEFGAIDFIPKPYPQPGVILARARRTIELSEDRDIIQSTERDPLTGLYNREYFYRYAEQFDQHHRDMQMDAIVVDVNHFHMINERFGNAYGDEVLRRIGERLREAVGDTGGIVCRREADVFMVYCPHGKDYKTILDKASIGLTEDSGVSSRVRLRMGVYAAVDKSLDIERRFDRAKIASDTVRNSFARAIGQYDATLHERELYAEQLIEDFHSAIEKEQFRVFYQPKFDVRPEIPVLASAEALVRWQHPELGLISPGVFIPLFEDNGLIRELDNYVWRTAAGQVREWRERLGFAVPVSVNVSRIDMYDPHLIETLCALVRDNGLAEGDLLLEITESAYTQDSDQIIETVNALRDKGFRIEMDDFGTGYSSLNMISTMPIDALKLDRQFVCNAFREGKDTRMLELIIDIADYLSVPVIAEGVETAEQLAVLREMGCDLVQGYYFSRPVPAEEYVRFLERRREQELSTPALTAAAPEETGDESFGKIAHALSSSFERIYYVDTHSNHYVAFNPAGRCEDLQIEHSGADFFAEMSRRVSSLVHPADRERVALLLQKETLLVQLIGDQPFSLLYRLASDEGVIYYNLKAVRAETHDSHHIIIGISNVDDQISQARLSARPDGDALNLLRLARELSVNMESIYYVDGATERYTEFTQPSAHGTLSLGEGEENFFARFAERIVSNICAEDREQVADLMTRETLNRSLAEEGTLSVSFRLLIDGVPTYYQMKVTLSDGSYLVAMSNVDTERRRDRALALAQEQINRDALTGVKSKHAFVEAEKRWNALMQQQKAEPFAVVWCDLNGLKAVNDTRGHQAGDEYIREACRAICNVFKHSPVYRVGGDEFVAVLTGADFENRASLLERLEAANDEHIRSGGVIIACGMSELRTESDSCFGTVVERADAAMYEDKKRLKLP